MCITNRFPLIKKRSSFNIGNKKKRPPFSLLFREHQCPLVALLFSVFRQEIVSPYFGKKKLTIRYGVCLFCFAMTVNLSTVAENTFRLTFLC